LNWAIEQFTNKGELIIDPFAGVGTTLRSAKKLNRNSIGIELDSTFVMEGNKFLS
jgi:DNA modification methylase